MVHKHINWIIIIDMSSFISFWPNYCSFCPRSKQLNARWKYSSLNNSAEKMIEFAGCKYLRRSSSSNYHEMIALFIYAALRWLTRRLTECAKRSLKSTPQGIGQRPLLSWTYITKIVMWPRWKGSHQSWLSTQQSYK